MRRVPGILLTTCATIIVMVALLISGLRVALPKLDTFRPQLLSKIEAVSGVPVRVGKLTGRWETFGPTLEVNGLQARLPDSTWKLERVTLALDVWQSLLHWRWQFRDLTFYNLQLDLDSTLGGRDHQGSSVEPNEISNLFLKQVDHFDLRNSRISFLTPSGPRAVFDIPQLTWLNSDNRHRVEGQLSLSTFTGQHGVVQLRMDLHDSQGLLNNGTVYLQADGVDLKPWLGRWLRRNTGLQTGNVSLAAWLQVQNGEIAGGDARVRQGDARWNIDGRPHRLEVADLSLHAKRQGRGWQFDVPQLALQTDGQPWPRGGISALWLPENTDFLGPNQDEELRLRTRAIQIERLGPLLPMLAFLSPNLLDRWNDLKPAGHIDALALDIPLKQPELTRFQAKWHDVSWQHWKVLPGVSHFAGSLSGSVPQGRLDLDLNESVLPYGEMFRAPLEVHRAQGTIGWLNNSDRLELWGRGLNVQARSLWATGDFDYLQPANGTPWLSILSGIRLYDAGDAWRYFPEPLMGTHLVDYLSGAIQGGQVENATLVYAGNPHLFPYKHNDGQFQVWVPLRAATFRFQPGWPALQNLDIDLNFLNDGLFMKAAHTALGQVRGNNVVAAIPDYLKQKLLVDADIQGAGKEVGNYFNQTPLKGSLGAALDELQIGGDVSGRLHLDIPLNGKQVRATGEVQLADNSLLIKPLDTTIRHLSGRFRYDNGNLQSEPMQGTWLGQPLAVDFSTQEQPQSMGIKVNLSGDWQPARLPGLPAAALPALGGSAPWKSQVGITLPHQGKPEYNVDAMVDLKGVSSRLPAPLAKAAGEPLLLTAHAAGGLKSFTLTGRVGKENAFNSRWLLGDALTLDRAAWQRHSTTPPPLPADSSLTLDLPALDGESWLALLSPAQAAPAAAGSASGLAFHFPKQVTLTTPLLEAGGQSWHNVAVNTTQQPGGMQAQVHADEADGTLKMAENAPWRADIRYLYYNPQFAAAIGGEGAQNAGGNPFGKTFSFSDWPSVMLRCQRCWFYGQNIGRVEGDVTPQGDTLTLRNGLVDTGKMRLTVDGQWQQGSAGSRTGLKGKLQGGKIDEAAAWLGLSTPLKAAPFDVAFDLHWQGEPWKPAIPTLNGTLNSTLGKGEIADLGGGRAGQLLRLISFDALLRKLQLDFSDTFGKGFYFDSIKSTIWIKDGVLHTDDLLVDGLAADIAMNGQVDLVRRQIEMEAVIAPEISATVGVATAFVINPVIGAAVFAATKALAPLWNKISLIRYHISGNLDQPKINEVLREPKAAGAK